MTEHALILNADTADFKSALIMGQGLPAEVKGQPVKYFWKEMLVPGRYLDASRKPFEIDGARVDNLIGNFKRASLRGYRPAVLASHDSKTGADSYGWIIDVRKNARGGLEGLHQLIGEDAHKAVARNGSSICTLKDVTDEHGDKYDELIDHNAIIPNPRLSGLQDFQPAIAASRGQVAQAVVLTLATNTQEPSMALIDEIKKALGAPDLADDKLVVRIGELVKADGDLKLANASLATAKTDLDNANKARGEAETKVLQLSRTPDADLLADRADIFNSKVDVLVDKGLITPAHATAAKAIVMDGDKPSPLMLSRSAAGPYRYEPVLKLLELGGNKLPGRSEPSDLYLSRQRETPGEQASDADVAKEAQTAGANWQTEQLKARGLATA
jgi:hypothetical protein